MALPGPLELYRLGDLSIHYEEHWVTVADRSVQLTATGYGLLYELSVNAGWVLTHDYLILTEPPVGYRMARALPG